MPKKQEMLPFETQQFIPSLLRGTAEEALSRVFYNENGHWESMTFRRVSLLAVADRLNLIYHSLVEGGPKPVNRCSGYKFHVSCEKFQIR